VARHLPFPLDDISAVNRTFVRWLDQRRPRDGRVIQLWTYCYVHRYFSQKFLSRDLRVPSDVDALTEDAYWKIRRHQDEIRRPGRFASWVSVICKHAFINHVREPYRSHELEERLGEELQARTRTNGYACDRITAYDEVDRAIGELPPFLRQTARMRLIDALTYPQISERTGKSIPTIRAYVHKALGQIRKDRGVRQVARELIEEG
jgi:RNA polymerase sigma factor (sigma-70 family)